MRNRLFCFLLCFLIGGSNSVYSEHEPKIFEKADGGIIKLDPVTRKAMLFSSQGLTPLWDGVHQMRDGSVLIVRDGVVVTGGASLPGETPTRQHFSESASCMNLVNKVCGKGNECSTQAACAPARQLLSLYTDEVRQAKSNEWTPNQSPSVAEQCIEALANESYFAACNAGQMTKPSTCLTLVIQTCGTDNQCASQPGCGPARQLFQMENEEISNAGVSKGETESGKQCAEALNNTAFFQPCQQ